MINLPPYDQYKRKTTFDKVKDALLKRKKMTMVELGMTRNENLGDGHSTPLWAYIAIKTDSQLFSVDISIKSILVTKKLLQKYGLYNIEHVHLVQQDARSFLKEFSERPIDFLYLDAWSYEPEERGKTEKEALLSFMRAENFFQKDSLILIDDVLDPESYLGKGKLVIPYAINHGYKCLHAGYQFLFIKA